jgi:gamma-glutamyltranspeptidase/glutathione hydrolase
MTGGMWTIRTGAVLLAAALASPVLASRPYRGGAVAAPSPHASRAAVEILDAGGNAVDAAVAAAFVQAVADPYHSGLGGGGFAVVFDARSKTARALDFRETAPKAASPDMYLDDKGDVIPGKSTDLGPSMAVPGAVAGYLELLRAYGKLDPRVVLAPAVRLARRGIWVTPRYASRAEIRLDCLRKDPEAARIYLRPGEGGLPGVPGVGAVLPMPDLARTLEKISSRGEKAFYAGEVARAVVDSSRRAGGILSLEDLASYRPLWREPLEGSYRGHRLLTMPPPSAGGVAVVQTLAALERRFPERLPYRAPEAIHAFAEILRRVYAERNRYLGDPAFVEIDLAALTSGEHAGELAAGVGPRATPSTEVLPVPLEEHKQTSHISVVDRQGNAVALTTTINYYFGSCVVAKGTGVLLNDEMDDFTAKPFVPNVYGLVMGEANAIAPGKRPASSMSPALVFQKGQPDRIFLAVGSPGGSTIPTTVIQTISNVVDYGMDVGRAVAWGRIHHQYLPDELRVDPEGLEPATIQALEALGHKICPAEPWGDAEAVMVDPETGLRYAASDPRNEGQAMGQD